MDATGQAPPPLFSKKAPNLSFGQYMASKIRKLRGQNDGIGRLDRLLDGVVIFVNGHTEPPREELRQLILQHGGQYEAYHTSRVTHMIATHVAESKLKELLRARKPLPVLHPKWILDSIEKGRVCRTQPYLYAGYRAVGQQTLQLAPLATTPAQTTLPVPPALPTFTAPPAPRVTSAPAARPASQQSPFAPSVPPFAPQVQAPSGHFKVPTPRLDHPPTPPIPPLPPVVASPLPSVSQTPVGTEAPTSPTRTSPPKPRSSPPKPRSSPPKATRALSTRDGIPAFVRHFFDNSRLHHIGSWKSFFQAHAAELMASAPPFVASQYGHCESTERVILHVDMDCFFVSVAVRNLPPVYKTVPVAVAHSGYSSHDTPQKGTSEISSCNYVARARGLRAGMFMERAKGLCPDLVVLPYDFEAIERISCDVYRIFYRFTPAVHAVSCDEAFLEFPKGANGLALAHAIRAAIWDHTKCTASVGVAHNILLARLATKQAKPDKVFAIAAKDAAVYVDPLSVRDLPGVGHVTQQKLDELHITTCAELQRWSVTDLTPHVGPKTALTLQGFARGEDHRPLELSQVAKSLSAEISYGVRLDTDKDALEFVVELAKEVQARLVKGAFVAGSLTVKVKTRQEGAPVEPGKFLGCGAVDTVSKTTRLPAPSANAADILAAATSLWKQFRVVCTDIRGIGIQASKLRKANGTGDAPPSVAPNGLDQWVRRAIETPPQPPPATTPTPPRPSTTTSTRPRPDPLALSLSQVDHDVLETLPRELRDEILTSLPKSRRTGAPEKQWPSSYSQIDTDVLSELPPSIQQEIRQTFRKPAQLRDVSVKRKPAALASGVPPRPPKRPTRSPPRRAPSPARRVPSPPPLSQIDASIWDELPPSIQDELGLPRPVQMQIDVPPKTSDTREEVENDTDLERAILKAITQRRLDVAETHLRRLRRASVQTPAIFNDILALANARITAAYGCPLGSVAPLAVPVAAHTSDS
ncbi:hypothetical protein SDRG_12431 [Saprolegnia diclina VS20]|uniref:DNA repair protein REV1 n=1 Tax=Saprolegnia diclina (strain VS20) TaxID=1156394 RepID=T0RJ20_SAPDV|nr:hypothetical protein SDRG_12431 [Saprolegnia diclina VS20]EQC29887.1 hypothetical protein SDRG_12431 [Saprolegnia diclina VS20]|eukprot:XP_008616726.1 hypothetical protein SDRG_12431 [Saprolegnia diclina VS20]